MTKMIINHPKPLCYFGALWLSASLLATVIWISVAFHNPNLEQIIFHILSEKDDVGHFHKVFIFDFLVNCVVLPSLVVMVLVNFEGNLRHLTTKFKHPLLKQLLDKCVIGKFPLYFTVAAFFLAVVKFSVFSFFAPASDYIENNYQDPASVTITKTAHMKNLILIYIEGLDQVYGDKAIFKNDALGKMNKHRDVYFNHYQQVPGAAHTIAAMVATQCGLPLKMVSLFEINYQGSNLKDFLPGATCLGSTLKEAGYYNVFLGGADIEFAGKGSFLKTHGYDEVYGKQEWLETGRYSQNDVIDWGLNDDNLFVEARRKLDALMLRQSPFNLTILTVNSHGPFLLTQKCKAKNTPLKQADVVKCSAEEVADFIAYVKDKGYLSNTNIVIMGDHVGGLLPEHQKLKNIENRGIYNAWISKDKVTKNREKIVHFDIAPSILEFIGFDVQGDQYGLGYSAFFETSKTLPENRLEAIRANILRRSDFYYDFWNEKPNPLHDNN